MKFAIIESYLKGLPELPGTVEGLTKKVNELTVEMRFPPLADNEMKRLVKQFCRLAEGNGQQQDDELSGQKSKTSNKGRRGTKSDEMKDESSENF